MLLRALLSIATALAITWALFVAALVVLRPKGIDLGEAKRLVPDVVRLLRALAADRGLPVGVRRRLGLLLAYLVHKGGLVPTWIAMLGIVGGPLVTLSAFGVLFGLYSPSAHAISAVPVFAWEVSFAVYLIVKGFRPSTATGALPRQQRPPVVTHF